VRVQLASSLQGVLTQTLIPTKDGGGRVVGVEIMIPNGAIRNLIREGKTHQIPSSMQTGSTVGMQTMDAALAALVRSGKITQRVAETRSSTPDELRRILGAGTLGGGSNYGMAA
jgi:twitching motility protein PilT